MDRLLGTIWKPLAASAVVAFAAPPLLWLVGILDGASLTQYLQQVISGTANGCVYALVALGVVLIYKATETINFAQGELMMVGAFLAYTFIGLYEIDFWLGALLAVAGGVLFGMATDRAIIRPVVGQPVFAIVMVTLGFGFVVRAVVSMIPGWGTDTYALETPFSGADLRVGTLVVSQVHAAIIASTLLLVGCLFLFFRYTRLGVAMEASSENQLAAYYMGIPVKRVYTLIWGLSAGVAAFAGLLLAPITFIHTQMGFGVIFKALPAAVLGGFGSIPGAIVGGLIIGVVEALAGFYLPEGFKDVAPYVVLLLVLLLKPEGIFGHVVTKKV